MHRRTSLGKITILVMLLSVLAGMLPMPAKSFQWQWTEPEYYETIQTADFDGDGRAELLARSYLGLLTYRFDTVSQAWEPVYGGDLGMTDAAGWTRPEYYDTIQTADIDGDGAAELLVRGANGLLTYRFKRRWLAYFPAISRGHQLGSAQSQPESSGVASSQAVERWELVDAGTLGMTDDGGWDQPQYYSTIQAGDIDGDGAAELLARAADGMHTYRFNTDSQNWELVVAADPGMSDNNGWNRPECYTTIQTADIDGDGAAELLARAAGGMRTYRFNTISQSWEFVPASDLGMTDDNDWYWELYYSTIQTGDIDGDGAAELLARYDDGMHTYRFNTDSQNWELVVAADPGMSDSNGWNRPEYYSTIQTGDIDGDGAAELLARAAGGMRTYRFNTISQSWERVPASDLGMTDDNGWDQPQYYSTIQTGDIDGDGAAELLARRANGLDVLRFNTVSQDWEHVLASGLGMGDRDRMLSSALRLFYPLGTDRGGLSTLDQSLGDLLTVEVCRVGKADGAAELLARRAAGMYTYRFDDYSQDWELVAAANPGMSDYAGWDQPQYYSTIQTGDIDGDGAAELLARSAGGMRIYRFDIDSESWEGVPASDLGMTDDNGWDGAQYYSTIQTGDIDGDGATELLARGAASLHVYRFNAASQDWEDVPTSDLGMSDDNGWDQPQYYSTIQTGDIDGDGAAELLARYDDGMHTYRFNTGSQDWELVAAANPAMSDSLGWFKPEYYATIQTADIDGDGAAELLARAAGGMRTYRFNTTSQSWERVPTSDLGMTDDNGWDMPRYYSTIQTGDIDGDGAAELLARRAGGMHTYRFDIDGQDWELVAADNPAMSDYVGWYEPQFYSTIQTGDIDGDGAAELLARAAAGMRTYRFNTTSQSWERVPASDLGMTDDNGWDGELYYSTIQTGDVTGCGIVAMFTDTIQLDDLNLVYRVDWQVANQDIGEPFEVHFAVADLRLGFASHTPDRAGVLPIRFRVDNHPLIRASVLHEQGRSATEVAPVLVEEFNWSVSGLWVILREAGLDIVEFGEMLRDLYEIDAQGAAQVIKSAGLSAFEAGLVLRDVYGQNAAAVAMILYDVGYPIADVIAAVDKLFGVDVTFIGLFLKYHLGLDPVDAARALKDTGYYQIHQVYEVLVNVYGVANWEDARLILLAAGYSDEEITEEVIAAQLAARFAPVLKFDKAASTFPMDAQKWWEDMLCGDDGGPPLGDEGYDYEACRTHSDGWGTENINDLWEGNSGISTLWEYGNKVPTYYRVESCGTRGQVRIEYWWFYGWQPKCDCCSGDHRADWEHIMVTTSEDWTDIAAVTYYQHSGRYTRIHGEGDPNFYLEDTHPVVFVGKTQHGSYHNNDYEFIPGTCGYYDDWRNPSDSSVWRTWQTPLIDLSENEQTWLEYDRDADWYWGYDSVGTHPTVATDDLCQVGACNDHGCWAGYSDCLSGDCDCGANLCSYSCWACVAGEEYEKDYWIPTSDDELMP